MIVCLSVVDSYVFTSGLTGINIGIMTAISLSLQEEKDFT